jgi:hypothetical protein
MPPIEPGDIAPAGGLHRLAQGIAFRWRGQQPDLRLEQRVGMDSQPVLSRRFSQGSQVLRTVRVVNENGLLVVSALCHQVKFTRNGKTGKSGHDCSK